MGTAWQPQEAAVMQLCHLLNEYQNPASNHTQILQQLDQCRQFPDFNNYLSFIFAKGEQLPIEVRQSAGLVLKNNLKHQFASTSDELRRYIKDVLLQVIVHPARPLRQTAGTVISVVVGVSGLQAWPELAAALVHCLQSQEISNLDGALDTLYKMVEDHPQQVEAAVGPGGQRASSLLVPQLLALFASPSSHSRRDALAILNMWARDMPMGLHDLLDRYLQGLFSLAEDSSAEVRREACLGLTQMLGLRVDLLLPHITNLVEYMLQSTQHSEEGVALEACEFWAVFGENILADGGLKPEMLKPVLPRLVPVLMKNMVFEEYDDEVQDAEAAELAALGPEPAVAQAEREQDLKPFVAKGREGAPGGVDDLGEDADDGMGGGGGWSVRKSSAAGLDTLSNVFGDELLPILLPIVQQRLQEADWRARESAILALGAVCEGCHTGLQEFLDEIVGMLLPQVNDARPMVRIITCWALSRYSYHILARHLESPTPATNQQVDTLLSTLLKATLDRNRNVQEAATSALATLEDHAGHLAGASALVPRLRAILDHLVAALGVYSRRNLRNVYDALSTLAEVVGPDLGLPDNVALFMPPLFNKFQALEVVDRELLPLLECLTALTAALGSSLVQYAEPTFHKCMAVVKYQMEAQQALAAGQAVAHQPQPDPDFLVCALDLISGLATGLGSSMDPLVAGSPLVAILVRCCGDEVPEVRQSAFALVGDLARGVVGHLAPAVQQLVPLALQNLEPAALVKENMSACNNACWCLGEMAVTLPPEMLHPFALTLAEKLAAILLAQMPRRITENAALTLGRVGWKAPEQIAPHLGHFCQQLCAALRGVADDIEKEQAFIGLCRLVRLNPDAGLNAFKQLAEAIVSWHHLPCDGLANDLSQILTMYRERLAPSGNWDSALNTLEPPVRDKLRHMFAL